MKNLISMTDFVLQQMEGKVLYHHLECVLNYAKFLKQPLELWMFVPCDEDGNVMESVNFDKHKQAKERCLFEGFELGGQTPLSWVFRYKNIFPYFVNKNGIVEDLIKYNLTLTPATLKQIGL